MLIGRVWHGLTREKLGDEYLHQLQELRLASYRRTPGNLARSLPTKDIRSSGVPGYLDLGIV